MFGLFSRSHMNAGQDGFRDASSKHPSDLWRPVESTECLASWIDRSHHLLVALQVLADPPPKRWTPLLRAWRNTTGKGQAGSPRRPQSQAAIPLAGADLAAENARLLRENERLRMEREILKKTLRIFSEAPK